MIFRLLLRGGAYRLLLAKAEDANLTNGALLELRRAAARRESQRAEARTFIQLSWSRSSTSTRRCRSV